MRIGNGAECYRESPKSSCLLSISKPREAAALVLTGLIAMWVQSEDSGLGACQHGDTKPSNIHVVCAFIHSLQPQAFAGAGPGLGAGQAGVLTGDSNLTRRCWRQR